MSTPEKSVADNSAVKDDKTGAAQHHDQLVDEHKQPLIEHLIELRQRILRSSIILAVIFLPIYFFANDLYTFVAAPLMSHLPAGSNMIATEVASPFLTPFKLAAYMALFCGMPFILHQAWAFASPGLYLREKRFAMPLLLSSIILFYLGVAFAYFVVFPMIFRFFASVTPSGVTMMTDINHYLDFVLKMFFAFGLAFEIPIAILLMVWTGISTAKTLAAKRPYVIVGCFVAGMLLTPPDVISQVLLAVPMWGLFEAGVLLARLSERKSKQAST